MLTIKLRSFFFKSYTLNGQYFSFMFKINVILSFGNLKIENIYHNV